MIFLKQPKVISWKFDYYEIMNHHCPLKKHRNRQYQAVFLFFFSWLTSLFFQVNLLCFTWFHALWALPCSCPYARGTRDDWAGSVDVWMVRRCGGCPPQTKMRQKTWFSKLEKGVMLRSAFNTVMCVTVFCFVKSDVKMILKPLLFCSQIF